MYNNLEIENGQEQRCKFYVVKSLLDGWMDGNWMDGWVGGQMDGWMDGWESGFKDCLQQSKIIQ